MNGHTERVGKHLAKEIGFTLAHQAVINVNTDESIADGAVNECRCNGGVNPAREGAEDAIGWAYLCGDGSDGIFGNAPRGPVGRGLGNVVHEVAQQALPARGVHHLRVELNPPQVAGCIGECGERGGVGVGDGGETRGCLRNGVAVAHPDAGAPAAARNASK